MIFDFHAHAVFKSFNSRSIYDADGKLPDQELWLERFRPNKYLSILPPILEGEVNYTSQIHLNALAEGNLRGVCVSLYPLERVFTVAFKKLSDSIFYSVITKIPGVTLLFNYENRFGKKVFYKLTGTLTGYDPEVIKKVNEGGFHYYKQMSAEYQYLLKYQNKLGKHGKIAYEIATDYDHYQRIIQSGKVAYIISAEGTNVLLDDSANFDQHVKDDQNNNRKALTAIVKANLKDFKSWKTPPFVITFAHHQYNFLCGHAPSFIGAARAALNQEGYTTDPNNPEKMIHYFLAGIQPEGKDVIRNMLSKTFGKQRTLIDTKHMSAKARMEYHDMVFNEYRNEDIPIIQTHTGVNGRPCLVDATRNEKSIELSEAEEKKSHFSTGSINLFDDEIVDIIKSNGMMGVMLDEKRIVGKKLAPDTAYYAGLLPAKDVAKTVINYQKRKKEAETPQGRLEHNKKLFKRAIKKLVRIKKRLALERLDRRPNRKKIKRLERRVMEVSGEVAALRERLEPAFLSILSNQYLHIVKVYRAAKAADPSLPDRDPWKHVCIGSDYEGVINPLDIYFYASDLARMETRWTVFLLEALNNPRKAFDKYRDVIPPHLADDYVRQILWGNSQWFLKQYFNKSYLT